MTPMPGGKDVFRPDLKTGKEQGARRWSLINNNAQSKQTNQSTFTNLV